MNYTEPSLEEAACKCWSENEEASPHWATCPTALHTVSPGGIWGPSISHPFTRTTLPVTVQTRSS